jgi:hypothetical protein
MAMSKWKRLRVPPICERVVGFSVPQSGEVLVISYEGMHLLHLANEITVTTDDQFAEYDLYDPDSGKANYQERAIKSLAFTEETLSLRVPLARNWS